MERRSPRIIDCPSGLLISPFVSHLSGLNVCVSGVSDVWSGHQRAVLKLKAVKLKSGDFYVFLLFSSLPPPLGPLTTAHAARLPSVQKLPLWEQVTESACGGWRGFCDSL